MHISAFLGWLNSLIQKRAVFSSIVAAMERGANFNLKSSVVPRPPSCFCSCSHTNHAPLQAWDHLMIEIPDPELIDEFQKDQASLNQKDMV
jgi:hypothetical protein